MVKKMWAAISLVVFIEFALYFFGGTTTTNSSLFTLLNNPSAYEVNTFYLALSVALGVFVATQIIPGNLVSINIWGMYAAMLVVLVTFMAHISHLHSFIGAELSEIVTGGSGKLVYFIQFVIMAPIMIFYLTAMAEWLRSNQ